MAFAAFVFISRQFPINFVSATQMSTFSVLQNANFYSLRKLSQLLSLPSGLMQRLATFTLIKKKNSRYSRIFKALKNKLFKFEGFHGSA